jgi:hypothetical protein
MAGGYDGSINIDTVIDTSGIDEGTEEIGQKTKKVSTGLSDLTKSLKGVALAIATTFSLVAITNFVKGAVNTFSLFSSNLGLEIRSLQWAFIGLQGAIVNSLAPAFSALYPYILAAINYLTRLFTLLAQISLAFLGVAASINAAKLAQEQMTKAMGAGALASFDQLNVLNAKPTLPGIGVPEDLLKKVQEFKDKLLEFLQPAIDAFKALGVALEALGKTIWEGLEWAWDNILVPLGKWVVTDLLPAFLKAVGAGAGTLNEILIAFKPMGTWLWDNFLEPVGKWTGKVIIDALKGLTACLDFLSAWIKDNPALFVQLIEGAGILLVAIVALGVALMFLPAIAVLVIAALVAVIIWAIANWGLLSKAGSDAWAWIQQAWKDVSTWFTTNVTDPIGKIFTAAWENIKKILGGINTFLTGVFSGDWTKAWQGLIDVFSGLFGGIAGVFKGVINLIIDLFNGTLAAFFSGLNGLFAALDSLQIRIPDWVPTYGGMTWGMVFPPMNAPVIPHLATGAVIPAHANMLGLLGEGSQKEIVAPEDTMRRIFSEELGKLQADVTINFAGTMGTFVREMKPYLEKESVRIGVSLIKGNVSVLGSPLLRGSTSK